MLRPLLLAALLPLSAFAQHTQNIWPATPPLAIPVQGPEHDTTVATSPRIAGRDVARITDVATPQYTVFAPAAANTGAAVVVFPGGGYSLLAYDLEGTKVCDWLTARGVTCVLLKYRVPGSGPWPKISTALADAQRTVGIVRSRAGELHIQPTHIGVLGFSAGAHLAIALSQNSTRVYPRVDAADDVSCHPDFQVLVYPGYIVLPPDLHPNPDIRPAADTPPTFLVQAEDDDVHVENVLAYAEQLTKLQVPYELHVYTRAGHGFGLRPTANPITRWTALADTWMKTIGVVP